MKAYKVTIGRGCNPYIEGDLPKALVGIEAALNETETGEALTVEVVDIPEEEYNDLPEWSGP